MNTMNFKSGTARVILLLAFFLFLCNRNMYPNDNNPKSTALAAELDSLLQNDILKRWYPGSIDSVDGGYFSEFTSDWKKSPEQPKMIVSQSRLIWTSSQAAMFYHDSSYIKYARHGVEFLKNRMWDEKYGGFYNFYNNDGYDEIYMHNDFKQSYGNAFAIYGLSAYYMATKDTLALELAKKCFYWLENHTHDHIYGGYIDWVNRDGSCPETAVPFRFSDLNLANLKDYNSSIHLLEAFTTLYQVWPDSLVKVRLNEMLRIVRDTIIGDKGYENLYFTPEWKHISNRDLDEETIKKRIFTDHVSFGHDAETAFLILEASHALNLKDDTVSLRIAKKLVDHSLKYGFDHKNGGFYDNGYYFKNRKEPVVLSKQSQWWIHAEGLNALLFLSKIYPGEKKYYEAFLKQWDYINQYLMDKKNGEWYHYGLNTNPEAKDGNKGTIWKVNYHNGRALMNCIQILRDENEVAKHFNQVANLK